MPWRLRDVVGGDPGQGLFRVAADEKELGEGALVENGDTLAGCLVLAADRIEPVLPLVAVAVLWRLAACQIGEPVRPLEAELLAEAGALGFQPVVERRTAERPAGAIFLERPGHGVVLGVGLERAGAHPVRIEMVPAEAADVDRPEIVRRLALGDPFGEHHACAAPGCDAEGVEAGADIDAAHLRRLAEDEVPVGGEAFRPVDELLDACRLHGGHAARGELEQRLEMVEVVLEKLELEGLREALDCPRLGIWLVAAHHQPSDLLLPIGEAVRVAQRRQVRCHALDCLGDEILVLHRYERNIDAGHAPDLARPLAGTDHELVASDPPLVGDDGAHALPLNLDAGDRHALGDGDAGGARALGERHGDV